MLSQTAVPILLGKKLSKVRGSIMVLGRLVTLDERGEQALEKAFSLVVNAHLRLALACKSLISGLDTQQASAAEVTCVMSSQDKHFWGASQG